MFFKCSIFFSDRSFNLSLQFISLLFLYPVCVCLHRIIHTPVILLEEELKSVPVLFNSAKQINRSREKNNNLKIPSCLLWKQPPLWD